MGADLDADIAKVAADLVAHKNNMATIHNMQAQTDAALLEKIQKNREDIAALDAKAAEADAKLTSDIEKVASDLTAHKDNMAEIHNMQAQTDAALLGKIQENRADIAAEIARATAAEEANAAEIARVDSVLKAAIENDGEGIDSIKELATWVEEHGKDAADIVKAVEDEAKARADADAELATDIADLTQDLTNFKNEQAQIHNMQAQNDAALLVKIQQNRENLANEVAAREALEATALQTVSTGVGLKATKTGTDAKVEIDDSVVFVFDCGSATTNID
jgi:chromosome segregation ATPase